VLMGATVRTAVHAKSAPMRRPNAPSRVRTAEHKDRNQTVPPGTYDRNTMRRGADRQKPTSARKRRSRMRRGEWRSIMNSTEPGRIPAGRPGLNRLPLGP